jgi:hypothetical protein
VQVRDALDPRGNLAHLIALVHSLHTRHLHWLQISLLAYLRKNKNIISLFGQRGMIHINNNNRYAYAGQLNSFTHLRAQLVLIGLVLVCYI